MRVEGKPVILTPEEWCALRNYYAERMHASAKAGNPNGVDDALKRYRELAASRTYYTDHEF